MKNAAGVTNVSYVNEGDDVGFEEEDKTREQEDKTGEQDEVAKPNQQVDSNKSKDQDLGLRVLTPDEKKEKRDIMKNILVISLAFFFLFTSYNSMFNLQSSLNKVDGTAALTVLYIVYILSCCVLPSWVLKVIKEKRTMGVSMLCYSFYILAQFYPHIYTLMPGAIIIGLAAAPLWSAKCTYLTKVSSRYGDLAGEKSDVIITRFFGIFFMFFQATQVAGNLISSLILSVGVENSTKAPDEEALSKCGYHFCIADTIQTHETNETNTTAGSGPPLWQLYTMATIFLGCALLSALIIFIFLDPLSKFPKADVGNSSNDQEYWKLLAATFNHLRHPYQVLIVPLTIWSGVEQAFLGVDYTAAYVSCGIGVHMIGYVMICYGVCDAVCSVGFSSLAKRMGRVPIFSLAFIINVVLIIILTRWRPHPDDLVWFFVISGFWGIADAVWQTQINSLYGVLFPGESPAAFSNYRLWESLGFAIAYACSTVLCIDSKITILVIFLAFGMVGYYVIEILEKRGGLKKDEEGKILPIDKLIIDAVQVMSHS